MVGYWHWHSIHNSFETYWKGLLSHDFEPNPTYEEAKTIGKDFERLSHKLINLRKINHVAVLFSNEALTALNSFKLFTNGLVYELDYNDVFRLMYDALYKMNIGCDFVDPSSVNIEEYTVLVVPPLYAAPDSLLERLNRFVEKGGHIVYAFRSGFSDENVKVRSTHQPGIIGEACGVYYSQLVSAKNISLKDNPFGVIKHENSLSTWIELLVPKTAEVLAYYDHLYWRKYAAITQNNYGNGTATYIGCLPKAEVMKKVLEIVIKKAGLWGADQEISFPLITKSGVNQYGRAVHYYFNYSMNTRSFRYPYKKSLELITDRVVTTNGLLDIEPWGVKIIEEI
jgi:beta-galactosidase